MLDFIISISDKLMVDEQLTGSLFVFVVFAILSVFLSLSKNLRSKVILSPLHFLMIGAFLSAFALFYPVYKATADDTLMGAVDAVISTVKMFGFDFRSAVLKDLVFGEDVAVKPFSKIYISFISFFVPVLTVTAALNIFKDTAVQIKYALSFGRKVHVFSELNEKSISFAKDICQNDRMARIVFTGVNSIGSDEAQQGLIGEAKRINALVTRKTVQGFHCLMHRRPSIYLIDCDETVNIKTGMELYKKHNNRFCDIYVFSTLESAETFIDAVDKKDKIRARIHLFNYAQIIAYDILAKRPMFEAADRCNTKTMSVLVIGADTVGMECAKAAMWCGVMDSYEFKLRIIGSQSQNEKFCSEYGTLNERLKKSGVSIDYKFLVSDIDSPDFADSLNECQDANYIIITTDDDETTVNVATKVRKSFIRNAVAGDSYSECKEPTIIPVISNINYYEALQAVREGNGGILCPYGSYSDIYKMSTIDNWPIEIMAEHIHSLYAKSDNKYHTLKQTEKRSNRANAVHSIYKMKDAGIDFCKSTDILLQNKYLRQGKIELIGNNLEKYLAARACGETSSRMEKLVQLEHNRWSVFQLLDGWDSWSIDDIRGYLNSCSCADASPVHKLPAARLHGCIVPDNKLREIGKILYNDPEHFIEYDRDVTSLIGKNITDIIDKQLNGNAKGKEYILMYISKEDNV